MKKTLLFVSLFAASASFAQNCSKLFISEYVEGSGNDKGLELYNPTSSPINLSGYSIERHSNGASDAGNGGVLQLNGVIEAFSTFVIVNGQTTGTANSPAVTPALQQLADLLDGAYPAPTYMNGNDAILLKNGSTIIDILGKSGDASIASSDGWSDAFPYDGSAGVIWTENHTLIRKPTVLEGVSTNPTTFIVTTEWDSLPSNTWSNLGLHTCNCGLGINKINKIEFSVFPNPSNSKVYVNSEANFTSISLVNMVGKEVLALNNLNTSSTILNVATLEKGIYIVRITNSDATISNKQIVVE